MAQSDRDDAPSLEPPSLFRRKRRRPGAGVPQQADPSTAAQPVHAEPVHAEPVRPLERAASPLFADELDGPAGVAGQPAPAPAVGRVPREPLLTGTPAACAVGLVVGLGTVALTWGSLRLCDAARGTSSCGGAGFFLLLAILVGMVLVGSALLRACRVPDPGSTSFLAVGLLTVIELLFLVDVLFSPAMVLVVPAFAVACFALSHWVTTNFVEPDA